MDARLAIAVAAHASDAYLAPVLARSGFARQSTWVPHDFTRRWIRRPRHGSAQFVEVSISLHPRDIPYFVGVTLGEGTPRIWLGTELYGLPLWQVVKSRTGGERPDYGIDDETDVERVFESIAHDLQEHAADFLSGDMANYRRLRQPIVSFPRLRIALVVGAALVASYLPPLVWEAVRRRRRSR